MALVHDEQIAAVDDVVVAADGSAQVSIVTAGRVSKRLHLSELDARTLLRWLADGYGPAAGS